MSEQFTFPDLTPAEPRTDYPLPGTDTYIPRSALVRADRDTQVAVMRQWFYDNFEDPAENTPYESREGGYQFIWGGPYDPKEQLVDEFGSAVADEVIEELADELSDIAIEWSAHPSSSDIDDYFFESIAKDSKHLDEFQNSIVGVQRLLAAKVEPIDQQCFLRLLYIDVICALETYLSDRFISSINGDRQLLRRFVETTSEFQTEKIPLSRVFHALDDIDKRVKTYLVELVWHRLDKVSALYRATLGVEFPSEMGELFKAILLRHDFVHRNGKSQDGREHTLGQVDIEKLISITRDFVGSIEGHAPANDRLPGEDAAQNPF